MSSGPWGARHSDEAAWSAIPKVPTVLQGSAKTESGQEATGLGGHQPLFHPNPASQGHPGSPQPRPVTSTSLTPPTDLQQDSSGANALPGARPSFLSSPQSLSWRISRSHSLGESSQRSHAQQSAHKNPHRPSEVTGGTAGRPLPQAGPTPRPPLLSSVPFIRDSLAGVPGKGDARLGVQSWLRVLPAV